MERFLVIFMVLFSVGALGDDCITNCTAEDEFPTPRPTDKWLDFMNLLEEKTLEEHIYNCTDDRVIKIDKNSDIVWETRFALYDYHPYNKTNLNDCYSEHGINVECGCKDFKECMASVREALYNELDDFWNKTISEKINNLCKIAQ